MDLGARKQRFSFENRLQERPAGPEKFDSGPRPWWILHWGRLLGRAQVGAGFAGKGGGPAKRGGASPFWPIFGKIFSLVFTTDLDYV